MACRVNLLSSLHDLAPCGPLYHRLVAAIQQDAAVNPSQELAQELDAIVAEAHTNLAATSLRCWRRLYTDASIASALVSTPLDAIAKLDAAIIVSGAAGEGRLDLILDLIQRIQQTISPFVDVKTPHDSEGNPITVLAAPPSLAAFQSREHKHPFILRAYAHHWPALTDRSWASTDYLRAVAGPGRVVPVEVGRDYRTDDWSQKLVLFDTFLAALDSTPDAEQPPLYLAQHSLLMQFPALRADIEVPDYVYADLPRPPGCAPPANDEQLVINAWLGPGGTISPAHTDPYFNTYVQVVGRKTVWMAPPRCGAGMYATGNTSGVDVFVAEHPEHPEFDSLVEEFAMRATLGPGDLLYMPAGWWHAMRAESRSFSVSMWF
ncbi:hypothetical protein C8F04DRAFT_1175655 [Mycena alexandri]|uniref:JmjC domain-containing protein n=1 Tax=Mycena alexandri TaxID=1745969 RepID=A0AAD6TD17_9AGAR|nr:hypothetical protein C8F04DRAFT_1175655 [Mycena alexandri]